MSNLVKNTDNSGGIIIQNYSETKNRIVFFDSIRNGFGFLRTHFRHKLGGEIEIPLLSEKVLKDREYLNTQVTTSGFLSKYSLSFKPTSFAPMISLSNFERHNIRKELLKVKEQKTSTQTTKNIHHQIPVQVLPNQIQPESNLIYSIMFLYPMEFDSFIIEKSEEKISNGDVNDFLEIQHKHKAIPVLLPSKIAHKLSEKYVKITGVIGMVNEGISLNHFSNSDPTLIELSSHFQDIYATNPIAFCLDCRDKSKFKTEVLDDIKNLEANLYLESQFDDLINEDLTDSILEINSKAFKLGGSTNLKLDSEKNIFSLPSIDDIYMTSCLNNIIGFSTNVDLVNDVSFKQVLSRLQKKHNSYREEALKFFRKEYNSKHLLKPNFVFDFRRSKMFYHKGALQSNLKQNIIDDNPELETTIKWLNS